MPRLLPLWPWTNKFSLLNQPFKFCFTRRQSTSTMRNILHVAEKNDAAKNISVIMSGGNSNRREGLSRFNKIYQFNYNFQGQMCNMIMTSVSGHLLGHEFPAAYRGWGSCNPVDLFSAPVHKCCIKDMENIKRTLEREVRQCDTLVIWTDCDREGENIGFEVIDVCKAVKPNIRVLRAKFSQITGQAINRAMNNLIQPDKRVSDAVNVRSELDLRIGASFTRFQTLRLSKLFPAVLGDGLISYGSCQFPTLGFVVERYRSIQDFISENFWKIEVTHLKDNVTVRFNWDEGELFDEAVTTSLFQACQDVNLATVEKVESLPKSKWRPVPLDTIELEKTASRKLRINAAETMRIAEKLYTQGLISYPRTETNIFPKDLALAPLVEMQVQDPNWGDFASRVLQDRPNPRQGKKSDQAHPPIHPTKYTNSLHGNEQKVYELIVRHFLACVSKDAKGHETKVEISIGDEKFHAKGLMVLERNYLEVYIYERWSDMEIPCYEVGEQFVPTTLDLKEGETSPPNLLTEPELISLMEKHGIGTDATHAEHIETIKKRNYAALTNNNYFIPQQLGMALVEGYDSMGFHMSKPYLRSELEADLKRICEGQKNPQEVLQQQIARYKEVFQQAVAQVNKLDSAVEQHLGVQREANVVADLPAPVASVKFGSCPNCGEDLILKQRREGDSFYISCSAYPGCRASIWFPAAVRDVQVSDRTCLRCGPTTKLLSFKFRRGDLDVFYPTLELKTCVMGCDRAFYDNLDIRGFIRRPLQGGVGGNQNGGGNNPDDGDDFGGGPPGGPGPGGNRARVTAPVRPLVPQTQPSNNNGAAARNVWNIGPNGDFGQVNPTNNDAISCNCNGNPPATFRTVRKEGPNKGRQFWGCDKPMNQGCGFFKWAEDVDTGAQQNGASNNPPPRPLFQSQTVGTANAQNVVCKCGSPASSKTVRRDGPNQGRPFWSCGTGKDCRFFQWADEDGQPQNLNNSWGNNQTFQPPPAPPRPPPQVQTTPTDDQDELDVMCKCGSPAMMRTVRKDGPNQGRQFWSCGSGKDCKFFQWADEDAPPQNQSGWGDNQNTFGSNGFGYSARGGTRKTGTKRKCSVCHREGHTKNKCPDNRGR